MKYTRPPTNIYYFGFLLLALFASHSYHVFLIEDISYFTRVYFLIYVLGQCLLEVVGLLIIANFMERFLPKFIHLTYIILTFLVLMAHLIDLPLIRIMDMSVWYVLDWLPDETLPNFIEMLSTTTLSVTYWLKLAGSCILLLTVGFLFFRVTDRLSRKSSVSLASRPLMISSLAIIAVLGLFDVVFYRFTNLEMHDYFRRALPWKKTFFSHHYRYMFPSSKLPLPESEKKVNEFIAEHHAAPLHRPNIFFFIAESVREDYITDETTPFLSGFRKDNTSFDLSFSNGNATQISWFSTFHSKLPLYWGRRNASNWEMGSPPLKILKEIGYKTHIYTSANLTFYQMDQLVFGQDRCLADEVHFFPHGFISEAWESDQKAHDKLMEDLQKYQHEEGHCFLVFFDATHFNYSWPRENSPFTPYPDKIEYVKATFQKEGVEGIINRYKNSLNFIDTLFGNFLTTLKTTPMWNDSVVVFMGDHGEEFMEQHNLFHASDLSKQQTRIPILYKFGQNLRAIPPSDTFVTSQIDIFPNILDYLYGDNRFNEILDGSSIFNPKAVSYAVTGRYNASRSPYEFCINTPQSKLTLRFKDEKKTFKSNILKILSLKDLNDNLVSFDENLIETRFGKEIDQIFRR